MKTSEMLRSMASNLRAEEAKRAEARRQKVAATLVAAKGLGMLSTKLRGAP